MRKKKNNGLKLLAQVIVLFICTVMLSHGARYMVSVAKYMCLRDSMQYAKECAENYKWTDGLHDDYEGARSEIINNDDPVVRLCYNQNAKMKLATVGIFVVMVISLVNICTIIRWDIELIEKNLKRRAKRYRVRR